MPQNSEVGQSTLLLVSTMFFYNNILLLETFKFEDKICLKHDSYNLEKVLNLV